MILVTGASGYVGGRLVRILEAQNLPIRCLARKPAFLKPHVKDSVEIVQGDVLNYESLIHALKGVHSAYYLVHSMGSKQSFQEQDKQGALNFARAAKTCGVQRIIYLGGLGQEKQDLSAHLKSRQDVGRWLSQSGVPVIEFRASIILGAGSLSFELIRNLVNRLPIMITPKWVSMQAQPIAIDNVLDYLVQALNIPLAGNHAIYEIGGPEKLSYKNLMQLYADKSNLKRIMVPVPFLTPWLSSLWLGLITPVYARIGRKLVESIRHSTVVTTPLPEGLFDVKSMTAAEAITKAIHESPTKHTSHWANSLSSAGKSAEVTTSSLSRRYTDKRTCIVRHPIDQAFRPIEAIGGSQGWYSMTPLWKIRGAIDLLLGGVGMRRGRKDPQHLAVGDYVDFWRVESIQRPSYLHLIAEMRLPGKARLEFTLEDQGSHQTLIRQVATFETSSIWGRIYWSLTSPFHYFIFTGMLKGIIQRVKST